LIHGTGVVIPLAVLWLYAVFFKGTPLLGNILVSLLVAYGPLFGALSAIHFNRIIIPALLAFLLNLIREIIKDVQDKEGDERAGIITTASLDSSVVRGIILSCAIIYVLLLFVPYLSHRFHAAYAIACFITVLPLHIFWLWQFKKENWEQRISKLSLYLKMEMVCGLLALLADEIWTIVSKSC
jgi:4-hydroxybenzoate polyprenyltransferase